MIDYEDSAEWPICQLLLIKMRKDKSWLGREGSNLRMPESKSGALPLGDAPTARRSIAASFQESNHLLRGVLSLVKQLISDSFRSFSDPNAGQHSFYP